MPYSLRVCREGEGIRPLRVDNGELATLQVITGRVQAKGHERTIHENTYKKIHVYMHHSENYIYVGDNFQPTQTFNTVP